MQLWRQLVRKENTVHYVSGMQENESYIYIYLFKFAIYVLTIVLEIGLIYTTILKKSGVTTMYILSQWVCRRILSTYIQLSVWSMLWHFYSKLVSRLYVVFYHGYQDSTAHTRSTASTTDTFVCTKVILKPFLSAISARLWHLDKPLTILSTV